MLNPSPVISFTFDDFPHSAVSNGARILNQHNLRGTFYLAGSQNGPGIGQASQSSIEDLSTVVHQGHELGCHTFHHARVSMLTASALREEIALNAQYIASNFPNLAMRTFAYPFGDISLSATRTLRPLFAACRTSEHGLNVGRLDVARLRSIRLYERLMRPDIISSLIREAIDQNAWLIFHTHDVSEEPSPYGCTPALLENAVREAMRPGVAILPVYEALSTIFPALLPDA